MAAPAVLPAAVNGYGVPLSWGELLPCRPTDANSNGDGWDAALASREAPPGLPTCPGLLRLPFPIGYIAPSTDRDLRAATGEHFGSCP
ncbi:hypothetical protein CCHR01_05338 [Colletotrichum chrysophilum]|uniref:Uncharacterized protein n=1 Tax=Colletotrichum chrysophilum TaxID=1836956 RepID=A0AAD9ELM3_9PEZI|nr:hypothetical protein CCHR01_05338 [Colletotrichum chrysophilum]